MCGLCGTKHAPGEPHKAMNASFFNGKTGKTKITGGYIAPNMARKRNSNIGGKSARSSSQNNNNQRMPAMSNRLALNNLAGKS